MLESFQWATSTKWTQWSFSPRARRSIARSNELFLTVFNVAGGRFLHLLSDTVKQFCTGNFDEAAFQTAMLDIVATDVGGVEAALMKTSGFGCQQLSAIRRQPSGVTVEEEVILALFEFHLIRFPISKQQYFLASTLVEHFVDVRCNNKTGSILP